MPLFPDPPNYALIPYHIDGSNVYADATTGSPTLLDATNRGHLTKQYGDTTVIGSAVNTTRYLGIQFAAPVDIKMWHAEWAGTASGSTQPSLGALEWSTTTTNFQDGTWTAYSGTGQQNVGQTSFLQTNNDVSGSGVTGVTHVRLRVSGGTTQTANLRTLLLYGNYTSGFGLELWHPTLDQRLTQPNLYYGDVPRSTSGDLTFRVKNSSPTLTANSITVQPLGSYETTPTNASQFTLSNGGAYASSVNIGNLAPGAISSVVTLRRSTLSNAVTGVWAVRVRATAGSWT